MLEQQKSEESQQLYENTARSLSLSLNSGDSTSLSSDTASSSRADKKKHQLPFSSYQNAVIQNDDEDPERGNGHVVLIDPNARGQLLREQAQSLIHVVDDQIAQRDRESWYSKLNQRQKALLAFLLFLLIYWWL